MNLLNPETSAGRNVKYEPLKRSFINVRNFSNDVHQRVCIMQWNILAQGKSQYLNYSLLYYF